jgi:hypothetical protein
MLLFRACALLLLLLFHALMLWMIFAEGVAIGDRVFGLVFVVLSGLFYMAIPVVDDDVVRLRVVEENSGGVMTYVVERMYRKRVWLLNVKVSDREYWADRYSDLEDGRYHHLNTALGEVRDYLEMLYNEEFDRSVTCVDIKRREVSEFVVKDELELLRKYDKKI